MGHPKSSHRGPACRTVARNQDPVIRQAEASRSANPTTDPAHGTPPLSSTQAARLAHLAKGSRPGHRCKEPRRQTAALIAGWSQAAVRVERCVSGEPAVDDIPACCRSSLRRSQLQANARALGGLGSSRCGVHRSPALWGRGRFALQPSHVIRLEHEPVDLLRRDPALDKPSGSRHGTNPFEVDGGTTNGDGSR